MNLFDKHDSERHQRDLEMKRLPALRAELFSNADAGVHCPCCGSYIKRYRRKFNSGMARSLIWLVRHFDEHQQDGYVHIPSRAPRDVVASREFDKLALWKCSESKSSDNEKKRESGWWRPTRLGADFVNNQTRLASHAVILNGNLEAFANTQISIQEALGKQFDYAELMGRT